VCEQAHFALPSETRAAAAARRFAAAQCDAWGLARLCEDVVLTVSELVTNAVVHARSSATLTISLSGDYLEVAVADDSARAPIVRPVRLDLEADIEQVIARAVEDLDTRAPVWHVGEAGSIAAGRGMLIVDAVSDEWGVNRLAYGKEVWFRLRAPRDPESVPCPCAGSRTLTPGGLPLRLIVPPETPWG
jgi:anti-sigma regulatory factor (Ser/Thr protein kinase)